MSITYTPTTNFAGKDSLPSNDSNKVVKGAEFTTEFTAIQSAFALAAPSSTPTFTGTATFDNLNVTSNFTSRGIDDNATSTAITIDANENVGIGTTNPTEALTVNGTGYFFNSAAEVRLAPDNAIGLDFGASYLAIPAAQNHGYVATASASAGGANGDLLIAPRTSAATSVRFITGTSPTERMRIDSTGDVGIGTDSPDSTLHVVGTSRVSSGANRYVVDVSESNSGYQAAVKLTDTGLETSVASSSRGFTWSNNNGEAMRIDSSGNVGIGDASPTYKLVVSGTTSLAVDTEGLLSDAATTTVGTTAGGQSLNLRTSGSTDMKFSVGSSEKMRIASSGDVGIGRLSPTYRVDVEGETGAENLLRVRQDGSSNGFTITGDGSTYGYEMLDGDLGVLSSGTTGERTVRLGFYADGNARQARLVKDLATYDLTYVNQDNPGVEVGSHIFMNGSSEHMRIDATGNVGIGTDSPVSYQQGPALNIGDTSDNFTQMNITTAPTGIGYIGFGDATTGNGRYQVLISYDHSANIMGLSANASTTPTLIVNSSGNVGIGTDDPEAKLDVRLTGAASPNMGVIQRLSAGAFDLDILGNDAQVINEEVYRIGHNLGTSSNGSISFFRGGSGDDGWLTFNTGGTVTSPTERMRIDSTGNVGIGTNDPGTYGKFVVDSGGAGRVILDADTTSAYNAKIAPNDVGVGYYSLSNNRGHVWYSGSDGTNERMRIDSSGNLMVGKITSGLDVTGFEATANGQVYASPSNIVPVYMNRRGATGTVNLCVFNVSDAAAGSIQSAAGGTPVFAAASDERLKDNITDHESELANVMALRPTRWDWKDANLGTGEGFIAQELEQTAWADLVSEGDDGYKQVAGLGAVETRLIKAMQEQQEMIEALKAKVEALENA